MREKTTLKRSALVIPAAQSTEEYYGYGVALCDQYTRGDGQNCVDIWWPSIDVTTLSVRVTSLCHVIPDTQKDDARKKNISNSQNFCIC